MRHLIKPIRLMIVASRSQSIGTKVQTLSRSGGGIGTYASPLWKFPEAVAKYYGKWQQYKKYIPSYYEEKYTYKPHKRVAGKIGQTLHSKISRNSSYRKLGKAYSGCNNSGGSYQRCY